MASTQLSSPRASSSRPAENAQQAGADQQQAMQALLARADVRIGGDRPWDLRVHDPRLYRRVLAGGSLALGESYMDGWWDCAVLDECVHRLLGARLDEEVRSWRMAWNVAKAKLLNLQSRSRAHQIGEHHYDRGNDLFNPTFRTHPHSTLISPYSGSEIRLLRLESHRVRNVGFKAMLDARMIYSCGYWRRARALAEAQKAKLDLICHKIGLEAGDRVLDIGCGWGGFLRYAAEEYGAQGVGVTVSEEQARLGRERCEGLPVELRLQDYRDLQGESFDHVVSVGMFEHVGPKNYRAYFDVVCRCLRPGGLFLVETIGTERSSPTTDPWIDKYIFPGVSMGAVIGVTYALRDDWYAALLDMDTSPFPGPLPTYEEWNAPFWQRMRAAGTYLRLAFDFTIGWGVGTKALSHGTRILQTLTQGRSLEEGRLPVAVCATDLRTGSRVVFRSGSAAEAAYASAAIAGVLPPKRRGDQLLVDGVYTDIAPVDVARDFAPPLVLAVDPAQPLAPRQVRNGFQAMLRAVEICQMRHADLRFDDADLVLRPPFCRTIDTLDFDARRECIAAGLRAVRQRRDDLHRLLQPGSDVTVSFPES